MNDTRESLIAEYALQLYSFWKEEAAQGGVEKPQMADAINDATEFVDRVLALAKS